MGERILHPIEPTYDEHSRILILGSFPSVKSREMGYFYGHPQNRFWKVLAAVFAEDSAGKEQQTDSKPLQEAGQKTENRTAARTAALMVPQTIGERRSFLLRHQVAVWDVIASCTINGSSDSSIKDVVVNDLSRILDTAPVRQIYVNGRKAEQLYNKYTFPKTGRKAICLPSTSPANAAWSLERLVASWSQIRI